MRSLRLSTILALALIGSQNMALAMYENEYSMYQQPIEDKRNTPAKANNHAINRNFTRQSYNRAQRRASRRVR